MCVMKDSVLSVRFIWSADVLGMQTKRFRLFPNSVNNVETRHNYVRYGPLHFTNFNVLLKFLSILGTCTVSTVKTKESKL